MEPIDFYLDAPSWSLGKSMAAHITFGRICEVYHKELENTIYQICGRRDDKWEMIHTRRDDTDAQRLDRLRSSRYKMVSEHTLTVGHDH